MGNLNVSPRQPTFLVRPALRPEMNRWRPLMRQHHYLGGKGDGDEIMRLYTKLGKERGRGGIKPSCRLWASCSMDVHDPFVFIDGIHNSVIVAQTNGIKAS
jgi:hypothetical protein